MNMVRERIIIKGHDEQRRIQRHSS